MSTDENLLFGVLALQADFIDAACFVEACGAWAARKDEALADLLVRRGWLTANDRAELDRLLQRKLHKHQGDARASLAEVTTDQVRRSLAESSSGMGPTTAHEVEARGRYVRARLHAQGGIGQVWLARDEQIGREVALKELRPERKDHPTARARFLEEARVTGQLEHPGIVPVYELAHGEDGSAFYSMRMVRGRTLAEAIKEYHRKRRQKKAGPLELRALLGAFVAVCNAVGYAHSRGVLHRDLKPANVVLGDHGEVVVLDWGLAKVVGSKQGEMTSLLPVSLEAGSRDETVQGQVLGTPGYMAPEQAEGRLDLLGPASDVYGLGATLYQILTGVPPFEGTDTPALLRRVVREAPTRPRQHVRATARALQAVCLKALAKKPADRYASASELAKEIERWLADEPVTAWREPLRLRAGRWVRRHQALVTGLTVGLLLFVLLGGAAGAWWAGERQRQRDAAESSLERIQALQQQGRLAEARGLLEQTRSRAGPFASSDQHARLRQARDDLDLVESLDSIRLDMSEHRRQDGRPEFDFANADRRYASAFAQAGLGKEGDDQAEVARRIGQSHVRDVILAALDSWAVATTDDGKRAWILGIARAVDPDPVRDRLREAPLWANKAELARAVAGVSGADLPPNLACALGNRLQHHPEGERLLRQAQQARPADFWLTYSVGLALGRRQDYRGAEGFARAAIALRPNSPAAFIQLAFALERQQRWPEAIEAYGKALEIDPRLAKAHSGIGVVLWRQGKWVEAEQAQRKALEIDPRFKGAHNNLGLALGRQGKFVEAEQAHRKALEIDPNDALAHSNLGLALLQQSRWAEAEQSCRKAITIDPRIANAHWGLGVALWEQGKWPQAEQAYRKATEIEPRSAGAQTNLGVVLLRQGKGAQAEQANRKAIEIDPRLAAGHNNLGWTLRRNGKWGESERSFRKAIEIDPRLAEAHWGLGTLLERQGKWAEAEGAYRKAIESGDRRVFVAVRASLLARTATLHPKLPAYLRGDLQPSDNDERLALARLCNYERRYSTSVRFYAEVFGSDARLADDLNASHRYDAACTAALAGDSALDEKEKARLRGLALAWLKADLALWSKKLGSGKDADRIQALTRVFEWQQDVEFAGVRDEKSLAALPQEERKAWAEFWGAVEALLKKVGAK